MRGSSHAIKAASRPARLFLRYRPNLASRALRALILVKTFTSLPDVAGRLYPWLPVRWLMRNRFPNGDKIKDCRRPTFIMHGSADHLVPMPLGKKLFEAAGEPKMFYVLDGAGHNDPLGDDAFHALQAFLKRHAPIKASPAAVAN